MSTITLRAAAVAGHLCAAGIRLGARRTARALRMRRDSTEALLGLTLAELFEVLGPAYIKLGQLLGTRRDLLGDDALRPLARLQDCLPPGPFSAIHDLFRRELGREAGDVFAEFEETPVASASVATVYRGRLHDGRTVAVKVLRPDVARRIDADLRLLRRAGRLMARLPPLRLVPVEETLEDFCGSLERQLDFRREAAASRRLREALAPEAGVVVPELVDELCSASILTMEFVDGLHPLTRDRGEDGRSALRAAVRALYRMIFAEGRIHCDLHRGNLHCLDGGRAAILDFGFVAELADADRRNFAAFFFALATNDGARCARITRDTALSLPPALDYPAFEAEVIALVARVSRASAGDFLITDFVGSLFDLQRRHGLRGSNAFVMPILALLVLEGICKEVDPDLDFQLEARPYVLRALISHRDTEARR